MTLIRRLVAIGAVAAISACAGPGQNGETPELGDFRLGHNVVLAQEPTKGPFSREATREELTTALADAIEERLLPYDGDGLYHLGISIGGYVLAQPGVPVVYTPKSVMIFDVTLYDNDTGEKLNDEPFRVTAFEGLQNTVPLLGSGITRTKEEQLENLTTEGARMLEEWLEENEEWFEPDTDQARVPFDREEQEAKLRETTDAAGNAPGPDGAGTAEN